jgi:hypothetical protein
VESLGLVFFFPAKDETELVVVVFGKLEQEDQEVEDSLGNKVGSRPM